MPSVGSAYVDVYGDMRRFNADVAKGATNTAQSSGKNFANTFAKFAAVGLAAFGAAKVFTGFIADAQESARVTRLTENAIKATGGAANVTAGQVGDLSTALSNKTAVDDELIQSGANLILTFKNIRNEAGAGNDIFNQTTAAALDLSAAGFGSVESASLQLGKALNDPIKGLSALTRSGVTFTQQQKDQITVLTESGDILGAQKIILEEIQGQVGGAAAAAADPIERLKTVAGNLGETIGTALLPYVERFATFATGTLVPGVESLFAAFKSGESTGEGFIGFMSDVGVIARGVFDWLKVNVPIVWGGYVQPALVAFGGFLRDDLGPVLQTLWREVIVPAFEWLKVNVPPIWEGYVKPALTALWVLISEVLAPTILWLWKNVAMPAFGGIANAVVGFWSVVQPVFQAVDGFVRDTLAPTFMWLWHNIAEPAWAGVSGAVSAAWAAISPVFEAIKKGVGLVGEAFQWIQDIAVSVWEGIQKTIAAAINGVIGFINFFLDGINAIAGFVGIDLSLHIEEVEIGGFTGFAEGGIYPGYTPGKDIGYIGVSGGEAIMRPEWTRAVGAEYVDAANTAARQGGVEGVSRFLGNFGTGGLIEDILLGQFPTARVTSGYRPGDPGYHGSDNARDFAGPAPGDAQYMLAMDNWIAGFYPNSTELIHTPGVNLKDGRPYTYGSETQADHYDHVHWAMADASLLGGDIGDRLPGVGEVIVGSVVDAAQAAVHAAAELVADPLKASITALTSGSKLLSVFGSAANFVIDSVVDWTGEGPSAEVVEPGSADFLPGGALGVAGEFSANVAIMQAEAAKFGWGAGAQWDAQYKLEMGEAGFNNLAQNPTSTAFGLGQFLDSTWASYGPKTSDPTLQSRYMLEYIQDIYGDPVNAYGQWSARNPHWYDDGGRFPQGTVGFNAAGGMERVLTERQNVAFERLVDSLEGRDGDRFDGPLELVGRLQLDGDGFVRLIDGRVLLHKARQVIENRSGQRVSR